MSANYGHIPLSFEANRGQTDSSVQFLSRGQGYTLFLRRGEAVLALRSAKLNAPESTLAGNLADPRRRVGPDDESIETSIVRMKLVGANPRAAVHEEDEQITKTNYFLGNDPTKWRTDVPNYGRIRYSQVYPGIDLVYYGNQSKLEHDFVVSPGADPSRIRLSVVGAGESKIDPVSGDVILNTGSGELRLLKPVAYQESDGQRTAVSSGYRLLARNEIGFEIASYDRARPLVIDPVLVYSTYLGGSGSNGHGDQGNGIVVDSAGDAYVVGTTYSTNFPITSDAFDSQNVSALAGTGGTVFVSELNPTGTELLYSTYLGGSGGDY
ncbi:MAG TPA: SBBP repeat-containing protein, partial [Terracidiphilus sp.]|nr:SBBP repeat-containing protein [Terracidiphilus sp.]